ncbi:hypothetical protein Tco_1519941 [Tanacetum coccineum]
MKDDIMKKQIEASTARIGNETSSIASNQVDTYNDNTSTTASFLLPKELSLGSFLLLFNINNHSLYAITTLDAKDNIIPLNVYEYLSLDEFKSASIVENTTGTNEPLGTIDILRFGVNEQRALRMWICFRDHERRTMKGSYMGFADILQVCYGQQKIDDTTQERRYYEWVSQNYEFSKHRTPTSTTLNDHFPYNTNNPIPIPQKHLEQEENKHLPIRPRPCNYSFEEWLKFRIRHNNLHKFDHEFIFNEWIMDSYNVVEEYAREIGDPYSRRFDEYNRVFKNEIEHLSNEYILRIGKKGYVLDDVWEKCHQTYKKTNEAWHDEAYEEDKMWRIRREDRLRSTLC